MTADTIAVKLPNTMPAQPLGAGEYVTLGAPVPDTRERSAGLPRDVHRFGGTGFDIAPPWTSNTGSTSRG